MTEQPEFTPTTTTASSQILTMGKEDPKHKDDTHKLTTGLADLGLYEDDSGSDSGSATPRPSDSGDSDFSDDLPEWVPGEEFQRAKETATGLLPNYIQVGQPHFEEYQTYSAMYLVCGGKEEELKAFVAKRVDARQDPEDLGEMSTWQKGLCGLLPGDGQERYRQWLDEKYLSVGSHSTQSGTDATAH